MTFSDDRDPPFSRSDFVSAAHWIVEGPRSILYSYDHLLWWDKEYQLRENRNGGRLLTTLTVYRPFVCQGGLTWSILRRCDFLKSSFESVAADRGLPSVRVSYRRIEETHPRYDDRISQLAETLLDELRKPSTTDPIATKPEFVFRQLRGWFYGSIQFLESVQLSRTLAGWNGLAATIEASTHDDVSPEDLVERFETEPLNEPIDLPGPEVPYFHRYIEDWRLLKDGDDF